MPSPSPPVQLRELLTVARRAGWPFERAHPLCLERIKWPQDTRERRAWKAILGDGKGWRTPPATLEVWQRAYDLEPPAAGERPVAGLLAGLADLSVNAEPLMPSAGVSSRRAPSGYSDPFNPGPRVPPGEEDADRVRDAERAA